MTHAHKILFGPQHRVCRRRGRKEGWRGEGREEGREVKSHTWGGEGGRGREGKEEKEIPTFQSHDFPRTIPWTFKIFSRTNEWIQSCCKIKINTQKTNSILIPWKELKAKFFFKAFTVTQNNIITQSKSNKMYEVCVFCV